jgi:hypothetical protein
LSQSAELGTPQPAGAVTSRRGALWPWLVTPLITLALAYVLHQERRTAPPPDRAQPDSVNAPAPAE